VIVNRWLLLMVLILPAWPALGQVGPNGSGPAASLVDKPTYDRQGRNGAASASAGRSIRLHVQARDGYMAHREALNTLAAFRDNAARQLNEHFANPGLFTSEQVRSRIEREIQRLDRAAPRMAVEDSEERRRRLEEFDREFPLRIELPRGGSSDPLVFFATLRSGIVSARPRSTDPTLQRLANEIEGLIIETERKLRGMSEVRLNEIAALPRMFYELANKADFAEMSSQDAQNAVERYRTVLQSALRDMATPEQRSQVATEVRQKLAAIGTALRNEVATLTQQIDEVEELMIGTARTSFSGTVSENSFNYLLLLFGAIFIFLLATPIFYKKFDNEVARGLLRSDFILQFSTVFVLTSAIIILGIGGLIKEDQLPVLLAGISGYVLGQLGRGQRDSAAPPAPVPAPG
jgi:hypothetical protein